VRRLKGEGVKSIERVMSFTLKLVVSGINKSYNGRPVLRDCSFSFEAGDVYVLTGPNGIGKSTFLRICSLLEEPDRGEVNFISGERVLKKGVELRQRITLVLPGIGLFNTTVFNNVAYGLRIRGVKRREMKNRVEVALNFVGLTDKRDDNALKLSSGEAQRLGIARAMVVEPQIIFLDEPTASVDKENTGIIENIILDMRRERKSTIIITTHDLMQAERLNSRILTIRDGRIEG